MIKAISLLILSWFVSAATFAQTHLKGERFVEVQGGVVGGSIVFNQLGINSLISTGRYNRQYNAWKATASYMQQPIAGTDMTLAGQLRQFSVGWGYEFNLWRNAYRTRFVRGSVQPLATYETRPAAPSHMMADSVCATMTSGGKFLLGVDAGIDIEFAPLVLSFRQRWLPKSGLQSYYTSVGVGWRWHGR